MLPGGKKESYNVIIMSELNNDDCNSYILYKKGILRKRDLKLLKMFGHIYQDNRCETNLLYKDM